MGVGKCGSRKERAHTLTTRSRSKSPVAYLNPIQEEDDDFSPPSDTRVPDPESSASKPHGMASGSKGSEPLQECARTPRRKGVSREDTKDCECQEKAAAGTQLPSTSAL